MGGSAVSDDVLYDPAYAMPRQRTAERSALQNLCAALRNRNVGDARVELDRLSERFRHLDTIEALDACRVQIDRGDLLSALNIAEAACSTRDRSDVREGYDAAMEATRNRRFAA
jgi:hypothetical protein